MIGKLWPLRTRRWSVLAAVTLAMLQCVMTNIAEAIDILPLDYIPREAGTHLTALYYLLSQSDTLNEAGASTIRNNTQLQTDTGVFRQIYYGAIDGRSWAAQFDAPFGTERLPATNSRVSLGLETFLFREGYLFCRNRN
jgi:hypothetical protein